MTIVPKLWGREEIVINRVAMGYCMKRMVLDAGASCSWHYHRVKDETFHVESGSMLLEISDQDDASRARRIHMKAGDTHLIWPGIRHRFTGGPEGCVFYECSTPDDPTDCVRLEESKAAGNGGDSHG